jgi:hypothetical protein
MAPEHLEELRALGYEAPLESDVEGWEPDTDPGS